MDCLGLADAVHGCTQVNIYLATEQAFSLVLTLLEAQHPSCFLDDAVVTQSLKKALDMQSTL